MSNKYIIFVGHDSFIKKWKTRSNATELLPRDRVRDRVNSVFACEKRQFILSNWLLAFRKMCVSLWLLVAMAVKMVFVLDRVHMKCLYAKKRASKPGIPDEIHNGNIDANSEREILTLAANLIALRFKR